jgi:mono/diheme cytochrome c family protein
MKIMCLILMMALLAAIPFSLWSQDKQDGAYLFKARCGTCHEQKGEGLASAQIPPINKTPLSADQLASLILKGKVGKRVHYVPIVNIDEAGAKAIAEYVKNLK